jgi:superoxide dismutase, Fe-Mn family
MENIENISRRNFLTNTTKASIGLVLSTTLLPNLSAAITTNKKEIKEVVDGFNQKKLPYSFDALEPNIDKLTMEIHYSKHAAAYCKNLNEAYKEELNGRNKSLEEILHRISRYSAKMRNNAGGHFNHEMFWQCLTPNTNTKPSEELMQKINADFGSFDNFKTQFSDAAKSKFGSGWAWLVLDKKGNLKIGSTPNQDNPLMNVSEIKGKPILCVDVWEHAYYLKYQNKRADYINNFFKILNWDFVNELSAGNLQQVL